jgi:hypothetical protein
MLALMKRFLLTLSAFVILGSLSHGETPAQAIALWNGKDFTGWEFVTRPQVPLSSVFHVTADGAMATAGKPTGYLQTTTGYENFAFHAEWRWMSKQRNNNSGFFMHITTGPKDRAWPVCLQVQNKPGHAGDFIPMAGFTFAECPPPPAKQLDRKGPDSENPVGEWNTCDVICRGDTIECRINGALQNTATKCTPHAGKIGIQLEGYPFEIRNVTLAPLK